VADGDWRKTGHERVGVLETFEKQGKLAGFA
jgi:hypothetical protein